MSDYPRPERWDRSRFESHGRGGGGGPSLAERDRYEEHDYYQPQRQRERSADYYREPPRVVEKDRYYEDDRYVQRSSRPAPRYYEEVRDPYDGAMVHVPRARDEIEIDIRERERYGTEARPKFVRRQSSLNTFDRKPMSRYGDYVPEETTLIRTTPRRRSPPRFHPPSRYDERVYDDIRIAEPEYFGDEEFRGYREREIERVRRRRSHETLHDDDAKTEYTKTEIIEEEKTYPRRGKTRMPMRLVNKRAVIELGYPFEEEGETLIILKALGKEHIDEVIRISKEMNNPPPPAPSVHPSEHHSRAASEHHSRPPYDPPQGDREVRTTTYIFEHGDEKKPPHPDIVPIPPPPPGFEDKVVERRTEIIHESSGSPKPAPEVPRSVREWDVLSKKTSHSSHSHSRHRSPSPDSTHLSSPSQHTSHTRKTSKSHRSSRSRHTRALSASHHSSHHSSSSHRRSSHSHSRARSSHARSSSSSSDSTKRELIITPDRDESASIHGPLGALIVPASRGDHRSTREIEDEIRSLKAEQRALRHERDYHTDHGELVIINRERKSRSPSRTRSKSRDRTVEIRKDKKAPDPRIIRAMLATLT